MSYEDRISESVDCGDERVNLARGNMKKEKKILRAPPQARLGLS
jgi:hypothetical protein